MEFYCFVVSGIPSHTCRTAKGHNHKVRVVVESAQFTDTLQFLLRQCVSVHLPHFGQQLQIIALPLRAVHTVPSVATFGLRTVLQRIHSPSAPLGFLSTAIWKAMERERERELRAANPT